MEIKYLKALVALCRKSGITHYKDDGVEFDLAAKPKQKRRLVSVDTLHDNDGAILPNWSDLTTEQQLLYSSMVPGTEKRMT